MSCHNIEGAWQHQEVVIGWYPYTVLRSTPVLTKPGGGNLIGTLGQGNGIGLQSVRNPSHSKTPSKRPLVRGYAWCYSRSQGWAGWVKFDDIKFDQNPSKPPLKGPAGLDFEVGRTKPAHKQPSGCGSVSKTKPKRCVDSRETYLRYSPRGTAFHYLHKDDVVKLLIVDGPQGFAFCEVLKVSTGSAAKKGSRGWILAEALKECHA